MDFSKAWMVMYAGGTLKGAVRRAIWRDEYWMINPGGYLMRCSLSGCGPEGAEPACYFSTSDKASNDWVVVTVDELKLGSESWNARRQNPYAELYQFDAEPTPTQKLLSELPDLVKKLWWIIDPENPYRADIGCSAPMGVCPLCNYMDALVRIKELWCATQREESCT